VNISGLLYVKDKKGSLFHNRCLFKRIWGTMIPAAGEVWWPEGEKRCKLEREENPQNTVIKGVEDVNQSDD
jgi:hypothetical protein